ncbi:MAG: hypothetical protein HZC43_06230 [Nitrosomonadales bacterium]|nr:hypothetical protein [Nitrosomonadales bacterium]
MIAFTDLTGLAGSAIAMVAAAVALPGVARIPRNYLALLACAIAVVALAPFGALPPAAYLRGAIGDLSITSLVLLALSISRQMFGGRPSDTQSGFGLQILAVLAAAGLYPLALGIGLFDPYRLGFGNPWFVGALLLVALATCFSRRLLPATCIALAVLAWSAGWYESGNLWDYLLDPLLAVYATGALARRSARMMLKQP